MLYAESRPIQGYPDLLNYDALVTPGVVLLKDGGVFAGWTYIGPDLDAATAEEIAVLSAHVNEACCLLGDGWQLHCDLFRTPAMQYPAYGAFPDSISRLIDEERRTQHQAEGAHYESHTVIGLTYKPPSGTVESMAQLFIEDDQTRQLSLTATVQLFETHIQSIRDMLSNRLPLVRLEGADLLTYLHRCTTGHMYPVALPSVRSEEGRNKTAIQLDSLLGSEDFIGGFEPQVGEFHIRTVAVTGFPLSTSPTMLSFLNRLPCAYRWDTRFIFLDPNTARAELVRYRRRWTTKVTSIMAQCYEAFSGKPPKYNNEDAASMAKDSNDALTVADSGLVRFGYLTTTLVLYHEDPVAATDYARLAVKELRNHGFPARIERFNAVEALIGSLPGHGYENVRRPMVETLNLADLLPLTSIWSGLETNPSPYFPSNSPPLMYAATAGGTPFRVNFHVSDVGATLILGPIGSGKTTFLNLSMAQWLRYPDAQVRCFTQDYGSMLLTHAVGGAHYTFGVEHTVALYPLGRIDEPEERTWAAEWLEVIVGLQGLTLTPAQRNEIARALVLLAQSELRTLTDFVMIVQDLQIREALHPYTVAGELGWLLDASEDGLQQSHFQTFDMTYLMSAGDKQLVPVLLYLFHYIERELDGRPTLIPIDEAWMTLLKAVFADKVEAWMRRLRKKNAAILFVSQSVADLALHPKKALILESCQTKIYLANAEAQTAHIKPLYMAMGLNDREVEIIGTARPKRDYYYTSVLGRRLFDLNLGPTALAFVGHGGDDDRAVWRQLEAANLETWPADWLEKCGVSDAAKEWREHHAKMHIDHANRPVSHVALSGAIGSD